MDKIRIYIKIGVALVAGACFFLISLANSLLERSGHSIWILPVVTITIYLMWTCTEKVAVFLDKRYTWSGHFGWRLTLQLLLSALLIFSFFNVSYLCFKWYSIINWERKDSSISWPILLVVNGMIFFFYLLISGLHFGLDFLKNWQQSEKDKEILEKENIKAKLETLNTQINPHFLFNNLNILTVLIDKDPRIAGEFVERFSEVYRYVLNSRERELVTLKEELDFIENYLFLLNKRFGSGLKISFKLEPTSLEYYIPPLVLQMLIENAVKHNVVSVDKPLEVSILSNQEALKVTNKIQKKEKSEGKGFGIANITKRYELLSGKPVKVFSQNDVFIVEIPLLQFSTT